MSNTEQQDFWTDEAGPTWVARMQTMDRTLAPVLDRVLADAELQAGDRVLDIGCGAGTSTVAAARQVGDAGGACGLDISRSLLDHARGLAADHKNVSFVLGDAQTHDFGPDRFDAMISRFGVMFFADTTAAFANIAGGLRPGARLTFATWGEIAENPYFTMPAGIAKQVIGAPPKTDPEAPGPFAMRDTRKVVAQLGGAGLRDIAASEVTLPLTPPGDAQKVAELMCDIGPAHRALTHFEAGPQERARLCNALAEGLAPYATPDGIRIPALINIFTARTAG
ncbi:Demethylmenaquinone methyltransferase [Sulfitobacter sp. THAF37]|uniref:methyltransferase domain-containing protein n=1 Tax=Sulfitobacter sp. THAF37 TaxID=2587855 RepID=UPI001267BA5B|nr:methyltransferase domain-containing protein [Sulfitobacter sp. THAF37]QFT59903.1 Demethylmenaquinone methyltransferase [Sulfitobacter sp. THAF37]